MKAKVLSPALKNPTATQTRNISPESTSIVVSKATNLKCDHPGVVGEKDNYMQQTIHK